jgi:cytochrome c-type biogenesis protein CcmH
MVCPAHGADTPFEFDSAQQAQHYSELTNELRCLVCQNQSLADSHADLAQDLRNEIYKMLSEGASKQQIIDFLVERYGDFVLYRPPLKKSTLLLWFGPFVLLGLAATVAFILIKSRANTAVKELDVGQQEKLKELLASTKEEKGK